MLVFNWVENHIVVNPVVQSSEFRHPARFPVVGAFHYTANVHMPLPLLPYLLWTGRAGTTCQNKNMYVRINRGAICWKRLWYKCTYFCTLLDTCYAEVGL